MQRARSLAAEQAILDATLALLTEDGYANLTIEAVASRARASKSTIYRRWKNKEHLVLAVFERLPVPAAPEGDDFISELALLFGRFGQIMQNTALRGVIPTLVAECMDHPTLSAALIDVNERRRAPLRALLRRAIARGEIAADADVELAIDMIQGALAIRLYFLLDPPSPNWIRQLGQRILYGFGASAPTSR